MPYSYRLTSHPGSSTGSSDISCNLENLYDAWANLQNLGSVERLRAHLQNPPFSDDDLNGLLALENPLTSSVCIFIENNNKKHEGSVDVQVPSGDGTEGQHTLFRLGFLAALNERSLGAHSLFYYAVLSCNINNTTQAKKAFTLVQTFNEDARNYPNLQLLNNFDKKTIIVNFLNPATLSADKSRYYIPGLCNPNHNEIAKILPLLLKHGAQLPGEDDLKEILQEREITADADLRLFCMKEAHRIMNEKRQYADGQHEIIDSKMLELCKVAFNKNATPKQIIDILQQTISIQAIQPTTWIFWNSGTKSETPTPTVQQESSIDHMPKDLKEKYSSLLSASILFKR